MDRDKAIETLTGLFTTELSVICAYLFGSVARGEQGLASDVDIAVLFDSPPPRTLLGPVSRLQDTIEKALSTGIDLVVLNHAGPDLVHRVLRDGILICDRDPGRRVLFEVQSRNEYFDIQPYLVEYRKGQAG